MGWASEKARNGEKLPRMSSGVVCTGLDGKDDRVTFSAAEKNVTFCMTTLENFLVSFV